MVRSRLGEHGTGSSVISVVRRRLNVLLSKLMDEVIRARRGRRMLDALPDRSTVVAEFDRDDSTFVLVRVPKGRSSLLTSREWEIAALAGEGMRNHEIAEALDIQPSTVAAHLRRIFSKLDVDTRTALARETFFLEAAERSKRQRQRTPVSSGQTRRRGRRRR